MRHYNPYRTDHPIVELLPPTNADIKYGMTKGIGRIYNDKIVGCCYDFNRDTETVQKSLRTFTTLLKNLSIKSRLKNFHE